MEMGPAIGRSMIEAHQVRLWVTQNQAGAAFCSTLPILSTEFQWVLGLLVGAASTPPTLSTMCAVV